MVMVDFNNNGYGGAIVPVPMYDSPMYSNVPSWYGSEPSSIIKYQIRAIRTTKAKVSSSKGSKAKLKGSKYKAHLNKHEQKNHTKKHKQKKINSIT
jgi:hypothetical protein